MHANKLIFKVTLTLLIMIDLMLNYILFICHVVSLITNLNPFPLMCLNFRYLIFFHCVNGFSSDSSAYLWLFKYLNRVTGYKLVNFITDFYGQSP